MDMIDWHSWLQLAFENEAGQFFNGRLSQEENEKLDEYIKNLSTDEKEVFFLRYIKNRFLNEEFIGSGAGLEDIDEIIEWLRYTYFKKG